MTLSNIVSNRVQWLKKHISYWSETLPNANFVEVNSKNISDVPTVLCSSMEHRNVHVHSLSLFLKRTTDCCIDKVKASILKSPWELIKHTMPKITKITVSYEDGSTQELGAPVVPTQTVTLTAGQTLEVTAQ
jgi:hypothetical protein